MEKEEIENFYKKHDVEKTDELKDKYPRFWENRPIPEGMRRVFNLY